MTIDRTAAHFLLLLALAGPTVAADPEPPIAFTRDVAAGEAVYTVDFGRLEVPQSRGDATEDRAGAGHGGDAATIQIAFARLRSTSGEPGPPLFYLAGTPGAATPWRSKPMWTDYLALGDVVLMDHRGSGQSIPALVWSSPDWDGAPVYGNEAEATAAVLAAARAAAAAWSAEGIDLSAFNAREAAADVDALRAALGYETIRLMGHSAGTHLGLEVVRSFGDRVERFVSIGTAGPNDIQKPPSELDASLRKVAALIAADPVVGAAVPDFEDRVRRVLAQLEREPLAVRVTDRRSGAERTVMLGKFGMQQILLQDMADENDLPVFPRLIDTVERGDTSVVSWFVQKRLGALAAFPAIIFVNRAASGATPERWALIEAQAPGSIFGRARCLFSPAIDEAFGIRSLDDDFRTMVASDVPTLFVSGDLDSHTPPHQAEAVRRGFTTSSHLVLINAGHDTVMRSPIVHERARRFLHGEDVPDEIVEMPWVRFAPLTGSSGDAGHPSIR